MNVKRTISALFVAGLFCGKVGEVEMSGGSLDYFYSELESHVGDFGDKELEMRREDD